tara:strand:+ start:3715 stop:4134 length:420 start_codon:yes stop_codon:yes gene_type:complete
MSEENEYDNTNTGVGFKPFEDQKFILQGKMDIDGTEERFAYITAVSRDGGKRIDVYQKTGALFPNDKSDNANKPDYTGTLDYKNERKRLASWKKVHDTNGNYMSLEVTVPRDREEPKVEENPPQEKEKVDLGDVEDIPF